MQERVRDAPLSMIMMKRRGGGVAYFLEWALLLLFLLSASGHRSSCPSERLPSPSAVYRRTPLVLRSSLELTCAD